jgi:hypothetical protein
MLINVVLPAPFAPTSPVTPLSTVTSSASRARWAPNCIVSPLVEITLTARSCPLARPATSHLRLIRRSSSRPILQRSRVNGV